MDIELLRTFVEVNKTRHFGKAAANLYLTQAAISARIRLLEQTVGVALFTRGRNDIQLTPSGRKLLDHANVILRSWTQARQELMVQHDHQRALIATCVPGVWETLLDGWLVRLRQQLPELVLSLEIADTAAVVQRLLDATADLGLLLEAPESSELRVKHIATLRLVLVASRSGLPAAEAIDTEYVFVNWGDWFSAAQARLFPAAGAPSLRLGSARSARALLLAHGGSAYLPEAMVRADLTAGRLHAVAEAPGIERAVNAVCRADGESRELVEKAGAELAAVAEAYIGAD